MDKYRHIIYRINKDIYSICFASLIDSHHLKDGDKDTLPIIEYNAFETSSLYLGALITIAIQILMIILISDMMIEGNKFHLVPAESFF